MEEPKVEAATLQARVQQDENVRAPVAADHAVLGVTLRMDEDEADQQAYTIEHAYMTEKASILRKHQEEYKKAFSYDSAKHQEMMHATHAAELALLDFEKTHSLGQIRKRKRADGIVPSPKRVKVALRDMALTPFMSRMSPYFHHLDCDQVADLVRSCKTSREWQTVLRYQGSIRGQRRRHG